MAKVAMMRVFVPIEDAPVDASMALLVPYRCGLPCEHALREVPDFELGEAGPGRGVGASGSARKPGQALP
ncbi:MAG: hypothetical protein KF766_14870 [Rhodocyclaceae bacterium]|nr:hypothetical protein [Rhodocyclaceae bacterium]